MTETIVIDAFVPVSPTQAWGVFTTPTEITQWNHASAEWHCPWATVELRFGGKHIARMEARDGSFGFDFEGTCEEVDAPHALTLLLVDGRRARTRFGAEGDGTRVATSFGPETNNPVEMQRAGWQAILDNFAACAARCPGTDWKRRSRAPAADNGRPTT